MHLVKKMVSAALTAALKEGTPNWDVTISRVLLVVLLAAIIVRKGDILARFDNQEHSGRMCDQSGRRLQHTRRSSTMGPATIETSAVRKMRRQSNVARKVLSRTTSAEAACDASG